MSSKRGFLNSVLIAAFALAAWLGLTLVAQAATLYISEYPNGLTQVGSTTPQIIPAPAITTQTVAVGGASVQSTAFSTTTKAVTLTCDTGCSILFGTNPTATTSTTLLQQGVTYTFGTVSGQKVAVIANSAGNLPGSGGGTIPVTITTCGVGATDLCKAEDAVHTSGDTGVASWGVVTNGSTALAASGDYSVQGTDTAGNSRVVGNIANAATDSGDPLKVGCVFNSSRSAVTTGQRVNCQANSDGTIVVAGNSFGVCVSITRSNNTTVYPANSVVGGAQTFALAGPTGGGQVLLTSSLFNINDSALISGEGAYLLYLYSVTPPSAYADNAAWDLPSGDRASYLGYVPLGTPIDLGSTLSVGQNLLNTQITLASTSLFGYLVTVGGYTPTAQRVYVPCIHDTAL